jgi:hypothetical protein
MSSNTKAGRKTALHMMHCNDCKGIAEAVRNLFAGGERRAVGAVDVGSEQRYEGDAR